MYITTIEYYVLKVRVCCCYVCIPCLNCLGCYAQVMASCLTSVPTHTVSEDQTQPIHAVTLNYIVVKTSRPI